MIQLRADFRTTLVFTSLLAAAGCSGSSTDPATATGGSGAIGGVAAIGGGTSQGGGPSPGSGGVVASGTSQPGGGTPASGGAVGVGGAANGGSSANAGGAVGSGGTVVTGGTKAVGSSSATGGTKAVGGSSATGGTKATGGSSATGGTKATGGTTATGCSTTGANAVMTKSGSTWTVTNGGTQRYSGTDTQAALTAAYNSLTSGRTTKQTVVVQGDGDIPASSQVAMPSYTIVNWCSGTLNISGSGSGDSSPFYARGRTEVEIANLTMTGSPGYGIFFRGTNNMILGNINLNLTGGSPGIGIRVDTSGSAGSDTTFVTNLTIANVTGGGMSSQLVETYGVNGIKIGTVTGNGVGECGLLLNRSINAEVDLVSCTNCGTDTGYAAFRVANSVGKIGTAFPAGNIHVKKVYARGGGRGIFSVSGCGGLTIDTIDIANTGSTSILLQNTYNTTIAATSGTVVGGLVQISNDTTNTNNGTYPPSQNVAIKNLVLSGGASVRQDWCTQYGANGCTATNVTGGTVSMCP